MACRRCRSIPAPKRWQRGRKLTLEDSGGATDANYASFARAAALDGFGIVGGNIHTEDQNAELDSIAPRLYLLTRMMIDLSGNK
jgi:glutamate carboxypeptidase